MSIVVFVSQVRDPSGLLLRGRVVRAPYACDAEWRSLHPDLPTEVGANTKLNVSAAFAATAAA